MHRLFGFNTSIICSCDMILNREQAYSGCFSVLRSGNLEWRQSEKLEVKEATGLLEKALLSVNEADPLKT